LIDTDSESEKERFFLKSKLLVIGLDGATFRIIDPLIDKGLLPTIQRLRDKGVYSVLDSTVDTNSPCAWSTFISGKNPGKHGIFGFFEAKPNSYDVRFLNGAFRSGKPIWRILGDNGKKVGVINVPFSYPAEEVNGFMIAGPDSPNKYDDKFAYPPGVISELEMNSGPYIIEAGASALVRQGKLSQAIQKLHDCIEARVAAARYFLKRNSYDFFMVVFTESDRVQHHFWKYINPQHPAYSSSQNAQLRNTIYDVYVRLDRAVEDIVKAAGPDYAVLLMSDHGAGPSSPKTFFINRWLESAGYLTYKNDETMKDAAKSFFEKTISKSYVYVKSRFSRRWKRMLRNLLPGIKNKASSILRGSQIDWQNTKAFSWENSPAIYINQKQRFPFGPIESGGDYERVREDIIRGLLQLTSPIDGERVVESVQKKEEVYWGPYLDKAPDLFVRWRNDDYTVRPGFATQSNNFIEVITDTELGKVETIARPSGVHMPEGIFIFSGSGINSGIMTGNLQLYDITAIILYYLGVPIPGDFDGRVVSKIFTDAFLNDNDLVYAELASERQGAEYSYSEAESRIIAERLQGLGYID